MENITSLVGILGALLVLIGFAMNQLDIWKNDSLQYDLINTIGGGILVYYAILLSSWPFAVLNVVWALVSLRDVFKTLSKKQNS